MKGNIITTNVHGKVRPVVVIKEDESGLTVLPMTTNQDSNFTVKLPVTQDDVTDGFLIPNEAYILTHMGKVNGKNPKVVGKVTTSLLDKIIALFSF